MEYIDDTPAGKLNLHNYRGIAHYFSDNLATEVIKGLTTKHRAGGTPGEVILVHNYAWHRSGINTTDKPRRGLTWCYLPAETKCLRKKRAPREFAPMFRGGHAPLA